MAAAAASTQKDPAPVKPNDEKRRSLEQSYAKEVPLKIIEQGDEEITAIANEINDRNVSPSRSTGEIIPPPPPEFANDTHQHDEEKRRSRKISKGSSIDEENEIKVQHRSSGGRAGSASQGQQQHQEVRRSFSVDDRTSSPSSSVSSSSKLNRSTITINDPSNSLASNTNNHVTVVTSHPPVIIDNSQPSMQNNKRLSKSLSNEIDSCSKNNEVVIVSNDTNKTRHVRESSTDDDYQSFDSLESSPKHNNVNNNNNVNSKPKARKLDESEVLIVSSEGIFEEEEDEMNDTVDEIPKANNRTAANNHLDTSHVSVVTVGDEQVKVKDSSHILRDSNSDLSNMSHGDGSTDGNQQDFIMNNHSKTNGQVLYNSKRSNSSREDDVNIIVKGATVKKRISPDSSVDCSSSVDSPTRGQSENGSTRSSGQRIINHSASANHKHDRSDAESISTTTSHDSRDKEPTDDLEGVQLRRKEPDVTLVTPPSPKRTPRTKEEIQIANLKKKTRKRTRRFEIDGVQMTTTTSKVIYGDEENGKLYDDHIFRKQELRELKLLQKQEKKQFYDLQAKEQVAKDQQEKKFEQERLQLERTYESDMDILARQHKQQVEKFEQQQENELRNTSKKIRMEQERELKLVSYSFWFFDKLNLIRFFIFLQFRDALKQELRLLKQEIDLLPKDKRKDEFKKRKGSMEVEQEDREKQFLANLSEQHETALRKISEIYREKMAATEKSYLQQRQTVSLGICAQFTLGRTKRIHELSCCQCSLFPGNENTRSDDVGIGGEAHSRETSALKATC